MIFSSRIESLKRVAADDTERKNRIRVLLRIRSLILWGALPVILFFFLFATILEISLLAIDQGRIQAADFMKMKDIIGGVAIILILVTFASLYLVNDADRSLRQLASLRDLEIHPTTERLKHAPEQAPESRSAPVEADTSTMLAPREP